MNNVALFENGFDDFRQEDTASISEQLLGWTVTQRESVEQGGGHIARCSRREGGSLSVSRDVVYSDDGPAVTSGRQRTWPVQIDANAPKRSVMAR